MLDCRLLHKTVMHLMHKVNWIDGPLIDWKYHGLDKELNFERIRFSIDKHLKSSYLYLVNSRTESKGYSRKELEGKLKEIIGEQDFTLWNIELTKVIEFKKVGVFRLGECEYISQDVKNTFAYFDRMQSHFPSIENEIEKEDLDMVFYRMEIFAKYTNLLIKERDHDGINRCFKFQESEYQNMNDLLLNALSVSYCEALLLGENSSVIAKHIEQMPSNLKRHYLDYKEYYSNLSNKTLNK